MSSKKPEEKVYHYTEALFNSKIRETYAAINPGTEAIIAHVWKSLKEISEAWEQKTSKYQTLIWSTVLSYARFTVSTHRAITEYETTSGNLLRHMPEGKTLSHLIIVAANYKEAYDVFESLKDRAIQFIEVSPTYHEQIQNHNFTAVRAGQE